jgi:peroxiredoxin
MVGMAVTSTMMPLGTQAPDFSLADVVSGRTVTLGAFDDRAGLLVMFICRHCPYVAHVRPAIAALAREHIDSGLGIVAISPNDPDTYPEDAPEGLAAEAVESGYTFPYLFDETQQVAKEYTAACTPDFFLFDRERRLVYRGQFDSSRPRNEVPVTGEDLRAAIDDLFEGREISDDQRPSVGCGIKWRPGNEPDFG